MPLLLFLIGAGVVALSHVAPFPMLIDAAAGSRSVWRMPQRPGERAIFLTYDDGPNPTATPALLDLLAREGVPATFFVIDRHLTPATAPLVRRMFDEGHAVALHSHTRRKMFMSPAQLGQALLGAADRIEQLAGRRPCRAFRPHGGGRSGAMIAGLAEIDYTLVGWSFGSWDKELFGGMRPERIARRLLRRASAGDVIVIHDGHHENPRADRQYAIATTALLIPELRARGFTLGRICGADGRVGG
jgi:peptidoglycan/xylan/chitin deacetylase (PgdA/CDA1 family)